jgi:ribose transport system permease protein
LGRYLVFVGKSPEVARLSGLRVARLKFGAFVVAGTLSALAGVILAGTLGSADPNAGASYLLPPYAAAFLGTTVVYPGEFNPWGTVIAIYFLATGITGFQLLGLQTWIQQVFYGVALILAVSLARVVMLRRSTAAASSEASGG